MKVQVPQQHAKNTAKMQTGAGTNTVSSGQNCLSMIMHNTGSLLHRMHELLKKIKTS
jgi:hypothetical protein